MSSKVKRIHPKLNPILCGLDRNKEVINSIANEVGSMSASNMKKLNDVVDDLNDIYDKVEKLESELKDTYF